MNIVLDQSAQHFMTQRAGATVLEAAGSHADFISQPETVEDL